MRVGASRDYTTGTKKHWRRVIWNEVLRRTAGQEKIRPIIYLAGRGDWDRACAVSKGVPSANLIAIDRDRRAIETIRAQGNVSIQADALDVLTAWSTATPLCAIVLDYCAGLIASSLTVGDLNVLKRPCFAGAVFVLNFLRGRDAQSNHIRETMRVVYGTTDLSHRGLQFFFNMAAQSATDSSPAYLKAWVPFIAERARPEFYSYRSDCGQIFDSVVFTNPFRRQDLSRYEFRKPSDHSVARKVAAALAVRTTRLRGKK